MSFLAPLFMLGALAIAAPIVYHLIRRTTRERTVFSSLMFLGPTPPRLTHRSRLEHWLLLLLRCLALGLLALGFARPFFRRTAPNEAATGQAKRIVVLVDASASMRRTGLWADARERVAEVLRRAGPADQVAVFTFGRQVRSVVGFEEWKAALPDARPALASQRLAALAPGWDGTHLGNALIRAAEALSDADTEAKTPPGPREIVLVGDLQAGSALDSLQAYDWPKGIALRIEALKAHNLTNAGLQLVADSPDADQRAAATVRVRVSNAADSTREQFRVGWLRADGADFAGPAVDAYVPPGQSRVMAVPVPTNAAGLQRIALRGDDEDFDNTVYVMPPEKQSLSVVYYGADAPEDSHQPLFFLQRALPDNPRLSVKASVHAPSAGLSPVERQQARLFFVTEALEAGPAAELREQLLGGKTVVFAPRSASAAATLGQLLGTAGVAVEDVQPKSYAMLSEIDFQHPLFAPFADPRYSDFTKIHVWKYRRIAAAAVPGARVIAKFDSGDPALLEIPVGKGRVLALMTGWNPEDSQLAVSSKFVPLLYEMLEYGAGLSSQAAQVSVGDPIAVPTVDAAGGTVAVRRPDGTTTTLAAGAANFTDTLQPGIYQLNVGSRTVSVAVNLDAAESRTSPLPPDQLERYGAPGAEPVRDAAREARREALMQGTEAESRQKLWRWFLGATMAVLLIESALAGWTARRQATNVTAGGISP
ncbi:MAG TPA: BatA domain-containing protein [Opitutaceae bacterium]|nr:BatA domain-containing protein [Opitutaceae bacterium]